MAQYGKKSFVLYHTFLNQLRLLSDEERGKWITAVFEYEATGKISEDLPPIVTMAFSIVKDTLDRDREAYEEKCAKNMANGRLGGRPKKDQKTDRFFGEPKKADNDSDNENDNENEIDNDIDRDNERSEAPQIARGGAREQEKRNYGTRGRAQNFTSSSIDDEDEFFAAALRRSQRVLEENFARTQAGG